MYLSHFKNTDEKSGNLVNNIVKYNLLRFTYLEKKCMFILQVNSAKYHLLREKDKSLNNAQLKIDALHFYFCIKMELSP